MTPEDFVSNLLLWLDFPTPPRKWFPELLTEAVAVHNMDVMSLAGEFRLSLVDLDRWASGFAVPHPVVQARVIGSLLRRMGVDLPGSDVR